MNIEVGEYLRTKNGTIFKIIDGNSDNYDIDFSYLKLEFLEDEWFEDNRYNDNGYFFNGRNIIKHSKNIIDLIEVGDFVKIEYFSNRYSKRVKRIFEVDCIIDKSVCFTNGYYTLNILNGEWANQDKEVKPIIKSIVTKEQFKNMEYRL